MKDIDKNIEGLYVIGLVSKQTESKIILCASYLAPESSSWGTDAVNYFGHLSSIIQSLDDYDFIFCGGGLNARIGAKLDFSVDIDTVTERRSMDCVTNKHGESFLEFLLDNKMCVLNGRVKGLNDFTCVRTQGRSLVDYCFTLHEQIQYIKRFYVKRVKEILNDMGLCATGSCPDHSVLITDVNLSDFNVMKCNTNECTSTEPFIYGKEYHVNNIPYDFMNCVDANKSITDMIEYIKTQEPSQSMIDKVYSLFTQTLNSEMHRVLPKLNKKRTGFNCKKQCPFWDDKLNRLFKEASVAERTYCKFTGDFVQRNLLHSVYKEKQKEFDLDFRKAKRKFTRSNEIEIKTMVNANGKLMWDKIDKIGPQKSKRGMIPAEVFCDGKIETSEAKVLDKWKNDFASLYKGIPMGTEGYDDDLFINEAKHYLENYQHIVVDHCLLNLQIEGSEVQEMSESLKNSKAVSIDKIPNEVLKNSNSIKGLCALYNTCFTNAIIPDIWRKALILPIYKGKGKDPKIPLNYRPVSLISNPCKGFSHIMNKRLLTYLEDQNILVEEQNGFRKGRNCQDHLFSLCSIIKKRIQL